MGQAWAKKRAEVSISFIVGVDCKVKDARVYESSDSRFEQPAPDAIRQFIAVYVTSQGQLGVRASSERYKAAIAPMGSSSEKLGRLRPVTFHLKTDPAGALQYGLIAEEVDKVYPDLVRHVPMTWAQQPVSLPNRQLSRVNNRTSASSPIALNA